jgi:hypothetical protein
MLGRDERYVAGVRLRSTAPMASLAFPMLLVVASAAMAALPCDAATRACADGQTRALTLLTIAAPTLPVVGVVGRNLPGLVVLVLGTMASVPLWNLVGRKLADRVLSDPDQPVRWRRFWRRYALVCAAWSAVALTLILAYRRLA